MIPPSIDVFSPKNQDLERTTVLAVLRACGVLLETDEAGPSTFKRQDGTPSRVDRQVELFASGPVNAETPVVLQVSRWDALKDPLGVIRAFARARTAEHRRPPHLRRSVRVSRRRRSRGARVLADALALRESLPAEPRSRVHLASLPMDDPAENAIIVNALQRHATVITQKSLAEGFGLTVAEAMWKARPVVASRIGGIQSQIIDGETGVLLDDPRDLEAFGEAVTGLLADPERAGRIGQRARERVRDEFTSPRSLLDYLRLIHNVLERSRVRAAA